MKCIIQKLITISPYPMNPLYRVCYTCNKYTTSVVMCEGCKFLHYCSIECKNKQKTKHAKYCKNFKPKITESYGDLSVMSGNNVIDVIKAQVDRNLTKDNYKEMYIHCVFMKVHDKYSPKGMMATIYLSLEPKNDIRKTIILKENERLACVTFMTKPDEPTSEGFFIFDADNCKKVEDEMFAKIDLSNIMDTNSTFVTYKERCWFFVEAHGFEEL